MRQVAAFIRLSRLYFLPLPVLVYAIGIALAERDLARLNERRLAFGLVIEMLVQLSVAYINDYWDIPTDRINQRRTLLTGGSGELANGALPPWVGPAAAAVCQVSAVLLALWAGIPAAGWLVLVVVMGLAVAYTTPPIQLAWRGLGELTTAAVAALLVPQWAYSLQVGRLSAELAVIGLPLVPVIMTLFLAIAAPDYDADRQVGKRTLVVRVGAGNVQHLYLGLLGLGLITGVVLWAPFVGPMTFLVLALSVPSGVWAWRNLRANDDRARLALLFMVLQAAIPALVVVVALNWGLRAG